LLWALVAKLWAPPFSPKAEAAAAKMVTNAREEVTFIVDMFFAAGLQKMGVLKGHSRHYKKIQQFIWAALMALMSSRRAAPAALRLKSNPHKAAKDDWFNSGMIFV
jgi:hypothetical protein